MLKTMMCLSWKMEQIEVNDSPSAAKPSTFLYVAKGLSFPFSRLSEWEQISVIEARKHAFEEGKNCDLPRNESSPVKKRDPSFSEPKIDFTGGILYSKQFVGCRSPALKGQPCTRS